MSSEPHFQPHDHGAKDIILAISYNLYGTRLATASADHHVRVWDKKDDDGEWSLTDAWRAHDGEVLDVKWNTPLPSQTLATISTDTTLKLWTEDPTTPRLSTHRFKAILTLQSPTQLPYTSLAFHAATLPRSETHLAAVTNDGVLTLLTPNSPRALLAPVGGPASGGKSAPGAAGKGKSNREADSTGSEYWTPYTPTTTTTTTNENHHLTLPIPSRGSETSFPIVFSSDPLPTWPALAAGLDRKSLGFAVGAMDMLKIYRTVPEARGFWLAAKADTGALVRDVAWSSGNVRGWDVLATAGRDGVVRVWELRVSGPPVLGEVGAEEMKRRGDSDGTETAAPGPSVDKTGAGAGTGIGTGPRRAASGISAGLAGLSLSQNTQNPNPSSSSFSTTTTTTNKATTNPTTASTPPLVSTPTPASLPPRTSTPTHQDSQQQQQPGRPHHTLTQTASLRSATQKGSVWRVQFSFTGDLLMSTGDDGAVRFWRRALGPGDDSEEQDGENTERGQWCEECEIDISAVQEMKEREKEQREGRGVHHG